MTILSSSTASGSRVVFYDSDNIHHSPIATLTKRKGGYTFHYGRTIIPPIFYPTVEAAREALVTRLVAERLSKR